MKVTALATAVSHFQMKLLFHREFQYESQSIENLQLILYLQMEIFIIINKLLVKSKTKSFEMFHRSNGLTHRWVVGLKCVSPNGYTIYICRLLCLFVRSIRKAIIMKLIRTQYLFKCT